MNPTPTPSPVPMLIELLNQSPETPVWVVPIIAGSFLLVGGLLGAIISYYSVKASDDRKAIREDARHWADELLLRAGRFLGAREVAIQNLRELQDVKDRPNPVTADYEALKREQTRTYRLGLSDATAKGQELSLIAPEQVRAVARTIVDDLYVLNRNNSAHDDSVISELSKKNREFIDMIRAIASVPNFD